MDPSSASDSGSDGSVAAAIVVALLVVFAVTGFLVCARRARGKHLGGEDDDQSPRGRRKQNRSSLRRGSVAMMVNPTFAGHRAVSNVVVAGYEVPLSPSVSGPAPPFDDPSTPPSAAAGQHWNRYAPSSVGLTDSSGPTMLPASADKDPNLHKTPDCGPRPGATKASVAKHAEQTYAIIAEQTYAVFSDPPMPAVATTDHLVAPAALVGADPDSPSAQYEYNLPLAAFIDYAEPAPIDNGDACVNAAPVARCEDDSSSAAMLGSQRQHADALPVSASSGDPLAAEPVGTAMAFLTAAVRLQPHMVYSTANDDIQASPSAADDSARLYDMPQTEDSAPACSTPSPAVGDALASAGDAYEVPMNDAAGSGRQAYDANHGLVYTGAVPVPLRETYAVPVPVCDTAVGMYAVPAAKTSRLSATTSSSLLVRHAEAAAATGAGAGAGAADCAYTSTRDQMQCRQKVEVGGTAYCANHTCPACNRNAKQWSAAVCAACLGKGGGGVAVARPYINVESDLAPDDGHASSASTMPAISHI